MKSACLRDFKTFREVNSIQSNPRGKSVSLCSSRVLRRAEGGHLDSPVRSVNKDSSRDLRRIENRFCGNAGGVRRFRKVCGVVQVRITSIIHRSPVRFRPSAKAGVAQWQSIGKFRAEDSRRKRFPVWCRFALLRTERASRRKSGRYGERNPSVARQ